MTGLYVLMAVVLGLLLLAQLRVGAVVEFSEAGLRVKLRVGRFYISVFPARASGEKKDRKAGKQKKQVPKEEKKPKGGLLELVLEFLPLVLDTAGKFKRRLRVDTLELELTVASADPADTAMQYGQANALMASLWQPITQTFHVKDGRAHIGIDFDATKPTLYLLASVSVKVGQALILGVVFGVKALCILIRARNKKRHPIQREAV